MGAQCQASFPLTAGYRIECNRGAGHAALHFDPDFRLWWTEADNRAVTASGHTQTSAETALTDKIAGAVAGLGEDIAMAGDDWSHRAADLLERLASRIRDGA